MKSIGLIFYYNKQNRYSINSLLGSLQTRQDFLDKVDVYLPRTKGDLFKIISSINYKKLILAISFCSVQFEEIKNITEKINFNKKDIILIAGGPHPTGSPLTTLKLGFDLCILGESEEIFLNFLEKILYNVDWRSLPSIAFFNEIKEIVVNERNAKVVNLDKYPPISTYFNCFGPIEITRGCPYGCFFCQTSQIFGAKLRHRSVEKICELVEAMANKGLYDTRFITPSLFLYGSEDGKELNLIKIETLFKNVSKIIKPKGKLFIGTFPSEIRPEHINNDTVYLLKKYADNDNVIIGAQSGSDRILELCNRQHTISDVYKAVQLLTKANFKVNLDFIFGLPYEEERDIKQTVKVIDELIRKYKVRIHAHIFMPLFGTKFQNYKVKNLEFYFEYLKELKNKGFVYGDWEKQYKYNNLKIFNLN